MVVSPVEYYFFNQKVYADGLSQENLPPASIGTRQASLYVKVNPPVLTTSAQAVSAAHRTHICSLGYLMQTTIRPFSTLPIK